MKPLAIFEIFGPIAGALTIGICLGITYSASIVEASTKGKSEPIRPLVNVDNPNQYFYGRVLSGDIFKYEKNVLTAVRVSPMHASDMYNQQITFCDNQEVKFGKLTTSDVVVITYSKTARSGLCYDLVSVDVVK